MYRSVPSNKEQRPRVYTRHQAFESVYQQLVQNPSSSAQQNAPLQHHHCPDKLMEFKDAQAYFSWGVELYKHGQQLLHALGEVTHSSYQAQTKLELKAWLLEEEQLQRDLHDYRVDVAEYQSCLLAAEVNHQDSYVEVLSDLIRHLDLVENRIITSINRKISEMNASRMTVIALMLSLSAVLMTAILVYINVSINLLK